MITLFNYVLKIFKATWLCNLCFNETFWSCSWKYFMSYKLRLNSVCYAIWIIRFQNCTLLLWVILGFFFLLVFKSMVIHPETGQDVSPSAMTVASMVLVWKRTIVSVTLAMWAKTVRLCVSATVIHIVSVHWNWPIVPTVKIIPR